MKPLHEYPEVKKAAAKVEKLKAKITGIDQSIESASIVVSQAQATAEDAQVQAMLDEITDAQAASLVNDASAAASRLMELRQQREIASRALFIAQESLNTVELLAEEKNRKKAADKLAAEADKLLVSMIEAHNCAASIISLDEFEYAPQEAQAELLDLISYSGKFIGAWTQ